MAKRIEADTKKNKDELLLNIAKKVIPLEEEALKLAEEAAEVKKANDDILKAIEEIKQARAAAEAAAKGVEPYIENISKAKKNTANEHTTQAAEESKEANDDISKAIEEIEQAEATADEAAEESKKANDDISKAIEEIKQAKATADEAAVEAAVEAAKQSAEKAKQSAENAKQQVKIVENKKKNIIDIHRSIIKHNISPENTDNSGDEGDGEEGDVGEVGREKKIEREIGKKLLNYIFEYDNEKEIKKRIKLLNAKYSLNLDKNDLNSFALYSDSLKDILDISKQQPQQPLKEITIRDVNTFIDILAKYKFSYNLSDIESDIKKFKKLCSKLGINNIDDNTAVNMLKEYFPNGKLNKSKLNNLYDDDVEPSNESENLKYFNIFLKSLDNKDIKEIFNKVYEQDNENLSNKQKLEIFKELFSDSNGKFKISSISKLF
jgi:chromosome segregation ATPase